MFRLGMGFLNFKAVQLSKCHTKYLLFNMLRFNNSRPKYVSFTFTGTRPNLVSRTSQSQTPVVPSPPRPALRGHTEDSGGREGGTGPRPAQQDRSMPQREAKGKTRAPAAPRSTVVLGFPDSFSLGVGLCSHCCTSTRQVVSD